MRTLSVIVFAAYLSTTAWADPQTGPKRKGPGFMKKGQGPGGARPDIVDRFNRLTPAERREALEKLPPERREMMERRLEQWRNTPPDQRRRLQGSYARFQEMPPERQAEFRELFRRFREAFPPDRAREAHMAVRRLRRADPDERKDLLNSPSWQKDFTEDERKLIEEMANEMPERE